MAKKRSVVNLATRKKAEKPVEKTEETVEEVVVDKDQQAKDTVSELLKDVPMEIKSGELLEWIKTALEDDCS